MYSGPDHPREQRSAVLGGRKQSNSWNVYLQAVSNRIAGKSLRRVLILSPLVDVASVRGGKGWVSAISQPLALRLAHGKCSIHIC